MPNYDSAEYGCMNGLLRITPLNPVIIGLFLFYYTIFSPMAAANLAPNPSPRTKNGCEPEMPTLLKQPL